MEILMHIFYIKCFELESHISIPGQLRYLAALLFRKKRLKSLLLNHHIPHRS